MQYYYQFDVAGIIVLILGMCCIFYKARNIYAYGKYCAALMVDALFLVTMDLITSLMIQAADPEMYIPLYIGMVLYFVSLNMLPYFCFQYIMEECGEPIRRGIFIIVPTILNLALLVLNYPYRLFFHIDPKTMVYSVGTSQTLYLLYFAIFIIMMAVVVHSHRRYFGKLRKYVLLVVVIASIADIFVLMNNPSSNFTGFLISVCASFVMIIFFLVDGARDPLTNINNRKGFRRASDELMFHHRGEEMMLIKVQIYNLNEINERFGRPIGDKVLIRMAESLESQSKDQDMVFGRIGGDTFAAMMCTNTFISELHSYNLAQYVQEWILDQDYEIAFYGGVCFFTEGEMELRAIMDRASYALDKVRGDFRKNICIFNDALEREYDQKMRLEQMARSAFKNDSFRVYLQPICDTQTKELVSAEALVRWLDKDGSVIPPDEFVPIFEKNGFITQVDLFVLDEVCRTIRAWIDGGIVPIPISVNVSRVDISTPHFVDRVIETVERYNLDHSLIKIELTESAFNESVRTIEASMSELRSNGFKILMDDFGSGYSNLNMFQDITVDIVKIDMKFLKNIDEDGKGRVVLQSVVNMSQELGLETVVEGVENETQFDFIKALHCEMTQGYFFDRPMPIRRFNEKLMSPMAS